MENKAQINPELRIPKNSKFERVMKGIPSSTGVSIGKAFILSAELNTLAQERISSFDIPQEIEKLESAFSELSNELNLLLNSVKFTSRNVYAVIEANFLLVNDSILIDSIKNRIKKGFSAGSALIQEFDHQKQIFLAAKDSLLRERIIELDQIKERLLNVLKNKKISYVIGKGAIIVAQALLPSDVIQFHEAGVSGIITEVGGISGHSSILARSFDITEVIGVKDATTCIEDGDLIIIDGYSGIITINPSTQTLADYKIKIKGEREHKKKLGELLKLPAETTDDHRIRLISNVNIPEDVNFSLRNGAEGIGLVRTENIVMELNRFPDEMEQYIWYNEIAEKIYPNFVTFRAFDVGSDKYAEGMPKHESNPALGFRGIRFLLHRKDIFAAQITAILRASKNKNVRFMLPMISTVNEIKMTQDLIGECMNFLRAEDVEFDEKIPIGIMIETPASALQSSVLADYCDFFSVGTNDLTQYTLAADRTNELVNEFFDSFHPAVLKLIKIAVDSAKEKGKSIGVCGEMAAHAAATSLLIGLGIEELSVTPNMLPELKSRIRSINYSDSVALARTVLSCTTYNEVRTILGISG